MCSQTSDTLRYERRLPRIGTVIELEGDTEIRVQTPFHSGVFEGPPPKL